MTPTATTLHLQTRHPLPEAAREASVEVLQERLTDAIALAMHAKQAHWAVRGAHFLPLHQLFDTVAEHAGEWADLLAERAGALGGVVDGTPRTVAERSRLSAYPADLVDGGGHAERMAGALATFSGLLTEAIEVAANGGDVATEDVLTEILRAADLDFWFVESHLQG